MTEVEQVKAGLREVIGNEQRYQRSLPSDQTIREYLYGWTVQGTIDCVLADYYGMKLNFKEDE